MKRSILVGCVVLLIIVAAGVVGYRLILRQGKPYQPPAVSFDGPSDKLQRTVIVPTLDTPMPQGKNVIWCGTLQLGWNHLQSDVLHAPPAIRGAEVVVKRLNRAKLDADDLPPESNLAMAGFIKDGIAEKVVKEMKERFQKEVQFERKLAPKYILLYSYLQAHLPFTLPFSETPLDLSFQDSDGKETKVTSFGIPVGNKDHSLIQQVQLLHLIHNSESRWEMGEFVVDLDRNSKPNQLVLACVPPKVTLLDTLEYVEKKTQEFAEKSKELNGTVEPFALWVPNMNWEIQHRFAELEGENKTFMIPGFEGYYFLLAKQTVHFQLDRCGAAMESTFQGVAAESCPAYCVFDRPFLLYMKKRGRDRPFFVMWVDNAELLSQPEK
ncbi:MAG: hypothetical protein JXB10_14610 [Pirellulales bacterium]|nr:hypothetical protein [Pirellulales bacterium]